MQVARAVGAQQRQIGIGVDAEHACVGDDALGVAQPDFFRRSDDVAIGQHQPVRRNDDAGTHAAAFAQIAHFGAGFHAHHGGTNPFGHADHGIGIGVQQRLVVDGGLFGRSRRRSVGRDI